jgi:hypothetical protein
MLGSVALARRVWLMVLSRGDFRIAFPTAPQKCENPMNSGIGRPLAVRQVRESTHR